jgi:hypothetical protein
VYLYKPAAFMFLPPILIFIEMHSVVWRLKHGKKLIHHTFIYAVLQRKDNMYGSFLLYLLS